ncbi:MAG: methylated-DNA--[protein]-cysteine S-methyltransferase [Candidatus Sumerlaeota bacterium]
MKTQKEKLQYTFARSSIGQLLIAKSAKGLCALLIGEDKGALRADLQRRFPRTDIEESNDIAPIGRNVAAFLEVSGKQFGEQLELRGTDFQRAVWNALRKIPAGTTSTYSEIAEKIGRPKAVRAVGAACAANHISIIVPCHRIVGSNGALTGYFWGMDLKRELLRRESE